MLKLGLRSMNDPWTGHMFATRKMINSNSEQFLSDSNAPSAYAGWTGCSCFRQPQLDTLYLAPTRTTDLQVPHGMHCKTS
jgi:hypothetical protein